MKGILSKRWLLCAAFGLALYVSALALTALLILKGVLKEELVMRGCTMSAFAAGFLSALAYRLSGKEAFAFEGILCGCGFLLPAFLVGFVIFDAFSASKALAAVAAALLGGGAASVLLRKAKTGKKKRGRKRSGANR